ncbi:hypothetical protein M0804_006608 [Polistes exclamans]|nr:hypothetical protein M0804_006608 [Polistes exclamans]
MDEVLRNREMQNVSGGRATGPGSRGAGVPHSAGCGGPPFPPSTLSALPVYRTPPPAHIKVTSSVTTQQRLVTGVMLPTIQDRFTNSTLKNAPFPPPFPTGSR